MTGPGSAILENTSMQEKASEFFPIVGYRYRSQAVVSEDRSQSPQDEIALLDRDELTGIPGTRVPHVWLERRSQRISTLDLLDGRFVLLTGSGGTRSHEEAERVATGFGINLAVYGIGPNADLRDPQDEWSQRMGVSPDGAVLIRPDGFVAWRGSRMTTTLGRVLDGVLNQVLCRSAISTTSR